MKTKALLITILSILAGSSSYGQQTPSSLLRARALTIVIDTSWSAENELPVFFSLSRQVISSCLSPGDDVEVITAHAGQPKIRLAQTIKTGNPDEIKNITDIVKDIRSEFLAKASISAALGMALNRLDRTMSQKQFQKAAAIVFSDGRLTDSDAERLMDLSAQFRKRGWSLYLTGTKDTNRKLLIRANQDKLNWSLITEANPGLWLQRQWTISTSNADTTTAQEPSPSKDATSIKGQAAETLVHRADQSKKNDKAEGTGYEVRTVVDNTVSISGSGQKTTPMPTIAPQNITEEPNKPATDLTEKAEIKQSPQIPEPSATTETEAKETANRLFWWILLPAAGLVVLLGLTFSRAIRNVKRWKAKVSSHLRKIPNKNSGILVAELNGQSYRLGQPDRLKSIHIGSGPENTIRVPDKSIQAHHVTIYAKDHDLILQNVSKSPVSLNDSEVKPGGKHRIVLPSTIRLNDNVKITLRLIRQDITPGQGRSVSNETKE